MKFQVQSARQLKSLQRLMAGAIMRPLTSSNGMKPRWKDGRPTRHVVESFIKPNDRLSSFERLELYNRQYWFRLLDAFYEDFPGLRAVVGDRKFVKLAEAYLERHPSSSFTMRNLGSRIGEFLRKEPRWAAPHGQLAMDVARFEWAQVVAFDSEARPVLKPVALAGRDPAKLKLELQPHIGLLALEYPVDDFLIALKKHAALRSEASNAMEAKRTASHSKKLKLPRPQKTFVAVHRVEYALFYKRLEPEAYHILSALRNGRTVGAACASALRSSHPNATDWGSRIQEWFKNWMSLGWFCKQRMKDEG